MTPGFQLLETSRVNRIMQAIQDVRTIPQQLTFLSRTPVVPAFDNEIMARFNGKVLIADLVADDQTALVYSSGTMQFEATGVPNLKIGTALTQADLNNLSSIGANPAIQNDATWTNWINGRVDRLLLGVRQRQEALLVAMALDSFTYDRFGIKITSGTWGMPSDLKVTVSTAWSNAGSATPVDDCLAIKDLARIRYGIDYNRMTMSTAAFRLMIATTEFQAKARQYLAPNVSYTNLSLHNLDQQKQLAGNVLGMTIELYDSRFWSQGADGTITQAPFLPLGKVILDSSANDGDPTVKDFANGVVTESIVASMMPSGMFGSLGMGGQRGPVAYTTLASYDLNAPGINMWGVARGFPRKYQLQSNAVMDIGAVTDTIPTSDPFA